MWIYSSGFPKSQDVGKSIQRGLGVKESKKILDNGRARGANKIADTQGLADAGFSGNDTVCTDPEAQQWQGWGTALKPAHEPIALARKPIKGSIKDNVLKHGVGALNIDATRVPYADDKDKASIDHKVPTAAWSGHTIQVDSYETGKFVKVETNNLGRFPSNVLGEILQDDYQKYFYCPKVSRRERHTGFELPPAMFGGVQGAYDENGERFAVGFDDRAEGKVKKKKYDPLGHIPTDPSGNNHPTVKPIELMKYLIKLITPKGGIVLDPFNGSGSTGCAAVELGHEYVGIELDPKYVEIAKARIEAWNKEETSFKELFTECR
jgi:site-specific DNA-methyltransferase (adenine-specific)